MPTIPTPPLDRTFDLIAELLPANEQEIGKRLQGALLVHGPFDLGQIERAARFSARPLPFAVLRREGLVVAVPTDRLAMCRTAYDMASRSLVTWGLTTVDDICYRVGTEDVAFVARLLAAHVSFQWLDGGHGWFWFGNARAALFRTIEKILGVAGSVRLADLSRTLFRRRPPPLIPPVRVLGRLCRQAPQLRVDGQLVRLAAPPMASVLSDADARIVDLFRKLGPRIDFRRSTLSFRIGGGIDETLRRLRTSPLVLEPQPGVFQLIGA